jgi:hypothetical protein
VRNFSDTRNAFIGNCRARLIAHEPCPISSGLPLRTLIRPFNQIDGTVYILNQFKNDLNRAHVYLKMIT